MYKSIKEYKRVLEQKGYIKAGRLTEDFDGEIEDADFVPHPEDNFEESEESEDTVTFETFKDAIIAEHESECIDEEGEETCAMLDEDQLKIAYEVFLKLTDTEESEEDDDEDEDDEDDDEMEEIEESFFKRKGKKSGSSAYKNTIDFIEGDSEEAKKIKDYYDKYLKDKSDSDIKNNNGLLKLIGIINNLGAKWAKANKMDSRDYTFKQIRTVLEGDFDRKFTGGTNVTVGESKVNEMLKTSQDVKVSFGGEDLIIPKGTRVTNKTADGESDPNYNFVDDFSWYKPELKGFARKMAIHDMVHRGINIDSQYVINESKNLKKKKL